jgi:hypothetical protein
MFGKKWEPGRATILAREQIDTPDGYLLYTYAAEIQPDSGAPTFRAEIKPPFVQLDWKGPLPGAVVRVTFDAKSRQVRFDMSDPTLHLSTARKLEHQGFEAALQGAPGDGGRSAGPAGLAMPAGAAMPGVAMPGVAMPGVAVPAAGAGTPVEPMSVGEMLAAVRSARERGDVVEVARLKAQYEASQVAQAGAARRAAATSLAAAADEMAAARAVAGATGPAPAVAPADPLDRLAKLADLRDRGVLTDEEFAIEKAKVLGGG